MLVPDALRPAVSVGKRLQVPFGRSNRRLLGYCVGVRVESGSRRPLKEVQRVVDAAPLLSAALLQLSQWMADYYLAPWGQVLETVLPAGVRGQAGTRTEQFLSLSPVAEDGRTALACQAGGRPAIVGPGPGAAAASGGDAAAGLHGSPDPGAAEKGARAQ